MNKQQPLVLSNDIYCRKIKDYLFIFIDKTSETICLDEDISWLIDEMKGHSLSFNDIIHLATLRFSAENYNDVVTLIENQITILMNKQVMYLKHNDAA